MTLTAVSNPTAKTTARAAITVIEVGEFAGQLWLGVHGVLLLR